MEEHRKELMAAKESLYRSMSVEVLKIVDSIGELCDVDE